MRKFTGAAGLAAGFLVLAAVGALAHGDVTPHPVDTTGLPPLGKEWVAANPYRGNDKAVAIGAVGYLHNCAGCHGLNAEAGGMAPDLLLVAKDCVDITSRRRKLPVSRTPMTTSKASFWTAGRTARAAKRCQVIAASSHRKPCGRSRPISISAPPKRPSRSRTRFRRRFGAASAESPDDAGIKTQH